jgi:hypothetical protein
MPIPYNKYTYENGSMKFHVSRSFSEMYNPTPGLPTTLESFDGSCINGMVTEVVYTDTEMILTIPIMGTSMIGTPVNQAILYERQMESHRYPEPKVSTLDPVKYAFWTVWLVILLDLIFR